MRALGELRAGRMVLLVSRAGGDVLVAADRVTPAVVNFMAREARGLVRLGLTPQRCDELRLPMQAPGPSRSAEPFTVSIEAREGVSTGISAADRARTIRVAVDPATTAADLVRPGHVFPLRAPAGGVLERADHAAAAVDLPRLAGLAAAGVLCEVLDEDGTVAGPASLAAFAARHRLTTVTTSEVASHLRTAVTRVAPTAGGWAPRTDGGLTAVTYRSVSTGVEHVALVKGRVAGRVSVPVHVHRECFAGTILGSTRCSCGRRLRESLAGIQAAGVGVLIYLRAEGGPLDGHRPPDGRDRALAARILEDLGVDPAPRDAQAMGSAAA